MTVSSKEHEGSTFTFVLPYRVSPESDDESDPDELQDASSHRDTASVDDNTAGYFQFQPRPLSSSALTLPGNHNLLQSNYGYSMLPDINPVSENFCNTITAKELEIEQPSAESSSRHSTENTAAEISGKNGECVRDEKNVGESQRSLDMEVVDSVSGSLVKLTSYEPHEAPQMMQTCLQSTTSSKPEVNRTEEKPKILLVEDNKINVMVTTSMMKQLGHSIDVVNNGIEAIRAVQSRPYDLVLMVKFNIDPFI